jgi:hypothetical protein
VVDVEKGRGFVSGHAFRHAEKSSKKESAEKPLLLGPFRLVTTAQHALPLARSSSPDLGLIWLPQGLKPQLAHELQRHG